MSTFNEFANLSMPQVGGFKVILEGLEIPCISAIVRTAVETIPTAEIRVVPHPILRRLRLLLSGQENTQKYIQAKPKLQIFYFDNQEPVLQSDSYESREFKSWKLLFDGEVTGISIGKTPQSKSYSLRAMGQPYMLDSMSIRVLGTSDGSFIGGSRNSSVTLHALVPKATGRSIVGFNWKTGEQYVRRLLAPIQYDFNLETKMNEILVEDAKGNANLSTAPFANFRGGKLAKEDTDGAFVKGLSQQTPVTEYYRKEMFKSRILQRFASSDALEHALYFCIPGNIEKLSVYYDQISNAMGDSAGQSRSMWELLTTTLRSMELRVVVQLTPTYLGGEQGTVDFGNRFNAIHVIPRLEYAPVPACNIVYPILNTQMSLDEDLVNIPTRMHTLFLPSFDTNGNQGPASIDGIIYKQLHVYSPKFIRDQEDSYDASKNVTNAVPSAATTNFSDTTSSANSSEKLQDAWFKVPLTEEEKSRGIVEAQRVFPGIFSSILTAYQDSLNEQRGISPDGTKLATTELGVTSPSASTAQPTDPVTTATFQRIQQGYADFMFYTERYQRNAGSVGGPFNPNALCGYPMLIVDAEDSGFHMVGFVDSITHSMSTDNQTTTFGVSNLRTLEEDISAYEDMLEDFHGTPESKTPAVDFIAAMLDPVKAEGIYQDLLGCGAVAHRSATPKVTPPSGVTAGEATLWTKSEATVDTTSKDPSNEFEDSSYIHVAFPKDEGSLRKFHSYDAAMMSTRRRQINIEQFYTEFLTANPKGSADTHKSGPSNPGMRIEFAPLNHQYRNDENLQKVIVVTQDSEHKTSGAYFNKKVREVVEMYATAVRSGQIQQG